MLTWRIGDVTITCIVEKLELVRAHKMFAGASQEAFDAIPWLRAPFADEKGRMNFSIHCFVVEAPGLRIVVDTCMGNGKERASNGHMLQTDFLERFEAAGFRRDSIDVVMCTHLHYDHVGWNTMRVDGRWIPTFPNARYLFGREEFEHAREDREGDHGLIFEDSVRPVVEAGLAELVEVGHRLCDEVWFTPTPGHTAGHVSVRIASKGEHALITGDMAHHPCQFAHPQWANYADFRPEQSVETRRRVFGQCADEAILFIGSHFVAPTAGRVIREGDAFRFATEL
jgi:glyoxylase-like metal-dependent hydrolase (beta-lactamase superfamily II)